MNHPHRRRFLRSSALLSLAALAPGRATSKSPLLRRVRPSDAAWPGPERWAALRRAVDGRLIDVQSPLTAARDASAEQAAAFFRELKNPFYLGDEVGLTQSLGWVDAWTSQPSAYAVEARSSRDVAAAVDFARAHRLRLVVKGGGHSYLGTSNAPDSLLVWTRRMDGIELHDAFVADGCDAGRPQPAVSIGAGAMWGHVYDTVTTRGGRYVQGGGCMTVGVAGLIQSGGFGSFSKAFGLAAASLIEAEVVTADGMIRIANASNHPELFWGLKGGGGGSLGIVTRVTLRTHALPATFGAAILTIKATSDAAYGRLVDRLLAFYADSLFNPHWGEQIRFVPGNRVAISMVFQGLSQAQAQAVWQPFLDWCAGRPEEVHVATPPIIQAIPARHFWDAAVLRSLPGLVVADDRPGSPPNNVFWASSQGEAGQVLHAYRSAWLPAALLAEARRGELRDAIVTAARHWTFSLHCNKGLAGAPADAIAAARDTAINPAACDAFALLICAAEEPPAYPGVVGHEPDVATARQDARAVGRAMDAIRRLVPEPASYVSESDYFEADWQRAYWGANYPRLRAAKRRYDPDGLFFVHHGIGSEDWSADGFERSADRA